MKLTFRPFDLQLRHAFTISRGSSTVTNVVFVEIEHDGIVGMGEASPSRRYGETAETVQSFLRRIDLSRFADPWNLRDILTYVDSLEPGNSAAKAAVDIALHDWHGKKLGVPLYRLWGLNPASTPVTSFTIGIDTPEVIEQKVREAAPYPILKIKLGGENDEEIIRAVRRVTDKKIRVDANEGWKTKEVALDKIRWLESEGIEFVEQPMPAADLTGTAWLRERVNLPLIADENSVRAHHVPDLRGVFDGINIKLMKCTGLAEAQTMIHTAHACGLKVMIGCMIESSIAISAAAHLTPLVDFADLDGNVLITNDPYRGVGIVDGKLILPGGPGIGVSPVAAEIHNAV